MSRHQLSQKKKQSLTGPPDGDVDEGITGCVPGASGPRSFESVPVWAPLAASSANVRCSLAEPEAPSDARATGSTAFCFPFDLVGQAVSDIRGGYCS